LTGVEHAEDSAAQSGAARQSAVKKSVAQKRLDWREIGSPVVELAGIGVLSAGFWIIRPWSGLIVLGAGLIVLGFAGSPRFDRYRQSR
jgi:hypothetical protein